MSQMQAAGAGGMDQYLIARLAHEKLHDGTIESPHEEPTVHDPHDAVATEAPTHEGIPDPNDGLVAHPPPQQGHDPQDALVGDRLHHEGGADGQDSFRSSQDDTHVTARIDGEDIFTTAHDMISNAHHEVDLEMYEFQNPQVGHADAPVGPGSDKQQLLLDDLVAAKERGCDVNVVLDGSNNSFTGKQNNTEVAEYLASKGVNVHFYPPNAAKIDHVKLLVTDDNKALIGGMNWGTHSPANHDADVLIEGPEARKARDQIFTPDLDFAEGKRPGPPVLPPDDGGKVEILTTAPRAQGGGAHQIKDKIISDIDAAQRKVHAELFVLTDKDIINSLQQAHERGADVKVLLDPTEAQVNQKAMDTLNESGVPTKWYDVDVATQQKLHAKWAVVDNEQTIVGSANWSASGLAGGAGNSRFPGNHEADANVHDQGVNAAFEKQFAYDWQSRSTDVRPHLHADPTQV